MGRVLQAAALAAVAVSCGSGPGYGPADNPTSVRDVTGVEFGWSCGDSGCVVTPLAATPAPYPCAAPDTADYSYTWGRLFEICSVCVAHEPDIYWSTTPGRCRILACDTDADCPTIYQYSPQSAYVCVNGLCQNADTARFPPEVLTKTVVEQLCFAVHPRADTELFLSTTASEILSSVEAACPGALPTEPCTLPAECRAP